MIAIPNNATIEQIEKALIKAKNLLEA
jgi:hypothetical protein